MAGVRRRLALAAMLMLPSAMFFIVAVLAVDFFRFFARWPEVGGQDNQFFCERTYLVEESAVCQKANGLSSFFYMALPIAVVWAWDSGGLSRSRHAFGRPSPENMLIVVVSIYLTIGNLAVHGFCLRSGYFLDGTSMNLMLGIFFAQALGDLSSRRNAFWYIYMACFVLTFSGRVLLSGVDLGILGPFEWVQMEVMGFVLLPLEIKAALLSDRRWCRSFTYWLVTALATFAVASLFWLNGQDASPGCEPRSLLQPHAAWHALTALSALALWQAVRCEEESALPMPRTRIDMDHQELTSIDLGILPLRR